MAEHGCNPYTWEAAASPLRFTGTETTEMSDSNRGKLTETGEVSTGRAERETLLDRWMACPKSSPTPPFRIPNSLLPDCGQDLTRHP